MIPETLETEVTNSNAYRARWEICVREQIAYFSTQVHLVYIVIHGEYFNFTKEFYSYLYSNVWFS
jgi:hypothetical protein